MQPHNFFSTDATPSHSSRKNLILNSKKSPASTQEVSESENRPATRGTAHSEVQGDDRCTARCTTRCTARPMAALPFLLPTGDSRSGRRSFDSKLISLLPLDEAPVHVRLRRPRPLRFERLRVPVWNPYSRGRLGPGRKTERAAKEKPTPISQFFFAPAAPAPLRAPRRFGIRKSDSNSGHSPLRGSG